MAKYTQNLHQISVTTPLGKDQLYLKSFHGQEEFSRLFQYRVELYSDETWIEPQTIVGKNVTVVLKYPDDTQRFFNGVVSRFAYQGTGDRYSHYRAEMVPSLWMLTRTADCRIFQNMTIPDILKQVFDDHGLSDYKLNLTKSYPSREYCVQYRETAFNFVSRLMEQYGIFYFFQHNAGQHTLVLGDATSGYDDCRDGDLTFRRNVAGHFDLITSWEHQFEYRPGRWAHTDYDFESPKTDLKSQTQTIVNLEKNKAYEMFDYPGGYSKKDDGDAIVQVRMEEDELPHDVVSGTSICRSFTPGGKFKIKDHISDGETGKGYVLTAVSHSASSSEYATGGAPVDATYGNHFSCVPGTVTLRPARITPKPVVQGVQTAVVVGPPGEEIYPDKYGRVKVQFHWDRYGKKDDNSSCWMRVSQLHAGQGWGYMDIPRIGEEVIVDFLEGDPDQPIITGRVYNGDNMPPFALPDGKTRRGNTTKTYQGSGFNEMSMDDTPGEEQIRIHAQYNMDSVVENDETHTVHNNRTKAVDVDEDMTIGNNQTLDVGVNKTVQIGVNHSETVGANQSITVGANQSTSVGSNQTNSVGIMKNETVGVMSNEMVGAVKTTTVGAAYALSVGFAMNIAVGFYSFEQVGFDKSTLVGGELKIDVGSKVRIECGASSLTMDAGGNIVLEGVKIHVKGSGPVKIEGAKIDLN